MTPCKYCDSVFESTPDELAFYEQISPTFAGKKYPVPPPKCCPACRQVRRLAYRNERKLYNRTCDMTGKPIISIYSPDKPYKVYDQAEWWSDKWEAATYARDFDFSRTFTDQFRELFIAVPRISLHTIGAENSYYTCYTLYVKNCYLMFGAGHDEDCMFAKYMSFSKDTLDALCVYSSEFCYEAVASDGCYNCKFLANCRNCSDCLVIQDCIACKYCVGCYGLNNQEYCIYNEKVGKEKYEEFMKDYAGLTRAKIDFLKSKLSEITSAAPHRHAHIYGSEDCSGDAIFNSKGCNSCFDIKECEDCKYLHNGTKSVASQDVVYNAPDGVQYSYEVCSTIGTNLIACYFVWYCDNVMYSMDCQNSKNLFGCVGLRNKSYCIFNKQYTKEEYEVLVGKIIDHMTTHGEWGEFLHPSLAPCDYNETVAMEYGPADKEFVVKMGGRWKEDLDSGKISGRGVVCDDKEISSVGEECLQQIYKCEVSGREYKIVPQEFAYYKKMGLPLPRRHPDQRHYDRLKLHGAYRLYSRACANCGTEISTVYSGSDSRAVWCEKCWMG